MNTRTTPNYSSKRTLVLLFAAITMVGAHAARAQIVYSNSFEANTTGFTAGGSLSGLNRTSLPTDNGGLASANQSTWLGRLGDGVPKSGSAIESVTLSLSGLTPGQTYAIAFDLFIGASWDGSAAGPYGADLWRLTIGGVSLVNTSFSNVQQGVNVGAYSPQRYSDSTYTNTAGPDFNRFTGADVFFSLNQNSNYGSEYSIYYFGHGGGNPILTFTAGSATAEMEFARYSESSDSADEYWALDNVQVSVVPEPSTIGLCAAGIAVLLLARRSGFRRG